MQNNKGGWAEIPYIYFRKKVAPYAGVAFVVVMFVHPIILLNLLFLCRLQYCYLMPVKTLLRAIDPVLFLIQEKFFIACSTGMVLKCFKNLLALPCL